MSERTIESLKNSIIEDLTIELSNEPGFSIPLLTTKVKNATMEVYSKRNYSASSMKDAQIEEDMWNYYSTILSVARYDYNMIGAEGEKSHSENGVSRTYVDRNSLFGNVFPFVKIL